MAQLQLLKSALQEIWVRTLKNHLAITKVLLNFIHKEVTENFLIYPNVSPKKKIAVQFETTIRVFHKLDYTVHTVLNSEYDV